MRTWSVADLNHKGANDRRDMSAVGMARRKRFDESLDQLRTLGLSSAAVDYYRYLARKARKLPHELVCTMAEHAAEDATLAVGLINGSRPA